MFVYKISNLFEFDCCSEREREKSYLFRRIGNEED